MGGKTAKETGILAAERILLTGQMSPLKKG
jgi:hypothetical protein